MSKSKHFTLLAAAAFGAATLCAQTASAAPIQAPVDSNAISNYQGLEWAWASPCGNQAYSCGTIDDSFQTPLGWRLPTASEVAAHIASDIGAFIASFNFVGSNTGGYACASAWFSNEYSHCDSGDALSGLIWNLGPGHDPNYDGFYSETFYVRAATVPVPAAFGLLALGLGVLGGVSRSRRKSA